MSKPKSNRKTKLAKIPALELVQPLSANAKLALTRAQKLAADNNEEFLSTHHLLLAFPWVPLCVAGQSLGERGILAEDAPVLLHYLKNLDKTEPENRQKNLSRPLEKALQLAAKICQKRRGAKITTQDLLAALVANPQNLAVYILDTLGIEPGDLAARQLPSNLATVSSKNSAKDWDLLKQELLGHLGRNSNGETDILEKFTVDMTAAARADKYDPVVGRHAEIERMMSILHRRSKNNPVLIGEAGVGKTALVEGLAQMIAQNEVPVALRNKRILAVDLAGMVAGTRYRGDFEKRLRELLHAVENSRNEIILFIDELHTIVGAGSTDGSMDTANILKPALARGDIRVIGATTFDEWKHIEKDKALQRRFQKVRVAEPSVADTVDILAGLAPRLEKHHHIKIPAPVLRQTVDLTVKYLPERQLPDKAIDVLDEAMAQKSLQNESPTDFREQLTLVQHQKKNAILAEDFARAGELHEQEKLLKQQLKKSTKVVVPQVELADIQQVLAGQVGIPAQRLATATDFIVNLDSILNKKVFGQKTAVAQVTRLLKSAYSGLHDAHRPVSFILAGEAGCGQNALISALAAQICPQQSEVIRLDMSEFADPTADNALLGAAAGFVGYGEGGRLTEQVRKQPHSVIVWENLDHAHPKVWHLLEQILRTGQIHDHQGRRADFAHATIIATISRSEEHGNEAPIGFGKNPKNSEKNWVTAALGASLAASFDACVELQPLDLPARQKLARQQFSALGTNLERRGIKLRVTRAAVAQIAEANHTATDISRFLKNELTDLLVPHLTAAASNLLVVDLDAEGNLVVAPASQN